MPYLICPMEDGDDQQTSRTILNKLLIAFPHTDTEAVSSLRDVIQPPMNREIVVCHDF